MDINSVKSKIRKLKKLEVEIRFGGDYKNQPLLWNEFFDISGKRKVKYPLSYLLSIDNKEYRKIADEFLAFVYSEVFERLNIQSDCRFDKALLVRLGLPYDADISAVKKRFRELAKQYHPDKGGDPRDFIELVEIYKKLTGGNETVKTP
jgi:hypothetical protein